MKLSRIAATCLLLFSVPSAVMAVGNGYVSNNNTGTGGYVIFEFTEKGNPLRPVSTGNQAAWPSAIKSGSNILVYGSQFSGTQWNSIHRWISVAGAPYTDTGAVLTSDATEPNGIGPSTTTFDGTTYRIYYLVRGSSGPGTVVKEATSTDGITFTRTGTVFTSGPEAPGGISLSYACTDSGTTYLTIHDYDSTFATAKATIASASSPDGPFSNMGTVISPSGQSGTITGTSNNNFAALSAGSSIVAGHVGVTLNGSVPDPYIATETNGSALWFDRPLSFSPSGVVFADLAKNKVDLSFIRHLPDGTWSGGVTGYGMIPGVQAEYTAPVSSPAVLGPYTIGRGYVLMPYFTSGFGSTENPEPIRTSSGCDQ